MRKTRRIFALLITLAMLFSTIALDGTAKTKAAEEAFAINLSVYKSANSQARLSWNAVPNATGYDVQCKRETGDWKNDADYRSGTAYTSTDLLNIVYYFQVRAKFSDGTCSNWAEVWVNVSNGAVSSNSGNNSIMIQSTNRGNTDTGNLVSAPVIKKGLNVSYQEGQTITLEWDAVPNATHYWMYFYRLEDSSSEAYVVKGWLQNTKLELTLPAGTYEVLPQAQNSNKPHSWNPDWWQTVDGVRGSFTVVAKKTADTRTSNDNTTEVPVTDNKTDRTGNIELGAPVIKNLKDEYKAGEKINLSWEAAKNATHYWVYIYKSGTDKVYKQIDELTCTNALFSLPAGNYDVMVQAQNCNASDPDHPGWWQYTNGERESFTVTGTQKSSLLERLDQDDVFKGLVQAYGNDQCTFYACLAMYRRAALINGYAWEDFTVENYASKWWSSGGMKLYPNALGMEGYACHAEPKNGYPNIDDKSADQKKQIFIDLLAENPEGVVIYTTRWYSGTPYHAVLLTGYDGNSFYCYDSAPMVGRIVPLVESTIADTDHIGTHYGRRCKDDLEVMRYIDQYWAIISGVNYANDAVAIDNVKTNGGESVVSCTVDHSKCSPGKDSNFKTVYSNGKVTAVCKSCGAEFKLPELRFSDYGVYKTKQKTSLFAAPYGKGSVSSLKKGKSVVVVASVINAYGNKWLYTIGGKWICSDDVTKQSSSCKHKNYVSVTLPDGKKISVCKKCGKKK